MIRFSCEHCGHKIGVPDKYADKRGKCPECGNITTIPTESTLITFKCQNCRKTISVPKTHACKEAQCPDCMERFIVPSEGPEIPLAPESPSAQSADSGGILIHLDLPQEYRILNESPTRSYRFQEAIESERESGFISPTEQDEPATERHLPWFVDILLYPTSPSGLISLIIFVIIPMLFAFVRTLMGPLGFGIGLTGFFLNLAIGLYLLWFLTECVRDSAEGGTRAPEAFAISSLGEMWSQAQYVIGCYLIFLGPVGFYHIFSQKTGIIFWLLLIYGAFFFPMGLLACIMFDSIRGLNPILLIGSMFSTFFKYIGLVLLIVAIILAFIALPSMQTKDTQPQSSRISMVIVGGMFYGIAIYMALVIAHLIGRFFWRNREKLNWEV